MTTATSTPMATSHESRCSLRERGEGLACRARDSWSPSIVRRWDDIRVAFPREVHKVACLGPVGVVYSRIVFQAFVATPP